MDLISLLPTARPLPALGEPPERAVDPERRRAREVAPVETTATASTPALRAATVWLNAGLSAATFSNRCSRAPTCPFNRCSTATTWRRVSSWSAALAASPIASAILVKNSSTFSMWWVRRSFDVSEKILELEREALAAVRQGCCRLRAMRDLRPPRLDAGAVVTSRVVGLPAVPSELSPVRNHEMHANAGLPAGWRAAERLRNAASLCFTNS